MEQLDTAVVDAGGPQVSVRNPSLAGVSANGEVSNRASKSPGETRGRFYRPELDVVRFVAFSLVFCFHTLPWGPGRATVGVPGVLAQTIYIFGAMSGFGLSLFFTLSAFLICELLLRERDATGAVQAGQFYLRRILRIWPLYFAGLAVAVFIALLPGGDPRTIPWAGWAAFLLGNWYVVFFEFPHTPMAPLWSISVEEQFYLIAPWAAKYLSRRLLYLFAFAILLVANGSLYILGRSHASQDSAWANSFVQFENFAAGILLCLALHRRRVAIRAWQRLALIAVAALSWYVAVYGCKMQHGLDEPLSSSSMIAGYALVAIGCCALLLAFIGVTREALPSWAIYLGRISYGLYVFHGLAIMIVGLPFPHGYPSFAKALLVKGAGGAGLTFLLAWLSYSYFEMPFLKLKKRLEVIESRPL